MIIRREDLAWAAGLYEGEGVVANYRSSRFLALTMTDEDVVRRFREVVDLGRVRGPYQQKAWKPYWTWRACNFEHRQAVTAMLWPWLGPRRKEQLRIMFEWDKRPGDPGFGKGFRHDLLIKT